MRVLVLSSLLLAGSAASADFFVCYSSRFAKPVFITEYFRSDYNRSALERKFKRVLDQFGYEDREVRCSSTDEDSNLLETREWRVRDAKERFGGVMVVPPDALQ